MDTINGSARSCQGLLTPMWSPDQASTSVLGFSLTSYAAVQKLGRSTPIVRSNHRELTLFRKAVARQHRIFGLTEERSLTW